MELITETRLLNLDRREADLVFRFRRFEQAHVVQKRLPQARISGRSNSRDVQARLCAAGGGVAVLPRQLGDGVPGLERVDLGEPPPGRDIWVGYHRDFQRQPRLRALLDATEAAFASAPGGQALTPPGGRRW